MGDISIITFSLLSGATGTGAGNVHSPAVQKTIIAYGTTSAGSGAATIDIEGSHDGSVFVVLATISLTLSTSVAKEAFALSAPYRFIRANVTSISGTNASVTCTMGADI